MGNIKKLRIYTDGACSGNPGPGGWAAVLIYGDAKKEISGFVADTTNNRMELLAAIEGLKAVTKPQPDIRVVLYSDSAYVVNAIKEGWLAKWQLNNWRTSDKSDVKNKDMWLELVTLNRHLSPTYIKVKGHSDNKYNNRADALAVAAVKNGVNQGTNQ